MAASAVILVEDQIRVANSFAAVARSARAKGVTLPAVQVLDTATALDAVLGRGRTPHVWTGSECLLLDCIDRDAPDEPRVAVHSEFFALDILSGLREARASGRAVPQVVAFSRAMEDPLMRAALSEFMGRQHRVEIDRIGLRWGWRVDPADRTDGVLWAMFERSVLETQLHRVVLGERTGELLPPPLGHPVWAEVLPGSCLASFHLALRDEEPDVWAALVLGDQDAAFTVSPLQQKTILRIGAKYLESNPQRGVKGYRSYLQIARALAHIG